MAEKEVRQRLGLGLSGGGLRASFYHIGVLAQMAELNMLRHLEVISTVSGGSIIGALYYLHVKKLLESKEDTLITDQDYVDIVKNIEKDFLKETQKNIRMETFSSFRVNTMMIFLNYSRSDRIAELYNDWLYQNVLQGNKDPLQMRELKIQPKGGPNNFHPDDHNVTRSAKVPILVLNATSLNTGRAWQFTARTMGEPPTPEDDKIDKKPIRLRRAHPNYDSMTPKQQDFPLGHAVASSACVPGLFDPMAVSDLYNDKLDNQSIRVQLVDGGVHDNQGIEGLLRNDCTSFIVSDAAGQMGTENNPSTGSVSVLLRVSSILQDRVRTEGLLHLMDSQNNKNVAYMSLREGLSVRKIHWIDASGQQPDDEIIKATTQTFGVHPDVQDSLSKMRTDLDAFTEVEAYSLMLDGYLMSQRSLEDLKKALKFSDFVSNVKSDWAFKEIEPWINNPTPDYLKQLKVAQSTFGKALLGIAWLRYTFIALVLLLLYLFRSQLIELAMSSISIPISLLLIIAGFWLFNVLVPKLSMLHKKLEFIRSLYEAAKSLPRNIALLLGGTFFIKFYQWCINPLYVKYGMIKNLKKPLT